MKSSDSNIKTKKLLQKVEELKNDIEKKENKIEQLRKLSQEYSESNKEHLTVEQLSKVGIWKVTLPELTVEWSDELYNIFELDKSKTNLDYSTFLEFIYPQDRKKTQEELELAIKSFGSKKSSLTKLLSFTDFGFIFRQFASANFSSFCLSSCFFTTTLLHTTRNVN